MTCTAVVQQRGAWWIGWIEEVAGVNCQARTREELLDDLRSALGEALDMNRAEAPLPLRSRDRPHPGE
jgi:predicted RNase H-like HicB family nuclease